MWFKLWILLLLHFHNKIWGVSPALIMTFVIVFILIFNTFNFFHRNFLNSKLKCCAGVFNCIFEKKKKGWGGRGLLVLELLKKYILVYFWDDEIERGILPKKRNGMRKVMACMYDKVRNFKISFCNKSQRIFCSHSEWLRFVCFSFYFIIF